MLLADNTYRGDCWRRSASRTPGHSRGSTYATARSMLLALSEPTVTRWVTPDGSRASFDEKRFVTSRDTLYLLSGGGPGSPAPLITAFADAVLTTAQQESNPMPGRRLDPPLLSALDECATIVKMQTLPDLFCHQGGMPILAILASDLDGEALWGEEGIRTLWNAANTVTYGGGIKDGRTLETLNQLIGEHDIPRPTSQDTDPAQDQPRNRAANVSSASPTWPHSHPTTWWSCEAAHHP